jgi:alkanesulfonate monooxygenase SsuD/methylene tetrahydromethanopterin reductase-like flavin-dependent oxidoreductase (luciferase family)
LPRLVLRFDMRNPQPGVPKTELYQTAIDMAVWAEERGFHTVQFAEHHGSDDGYIPSPIVLAAAIAARTKRIRLRFGLIILPLNNPIKLAEDLAVLDIISSGRVDVILGAGYVPHEFEMFGVDPKQRVRLMEEGVEAIKSAWTGEPFIYRGRKVRVMPTPVQKPRPSIWLGGSTPAAARRAARIADDFYSGEPSLYDAYRDEMKTLGKPDNGEFRRIGTGFFVTAPDPDREWARTGPYILHEVNSYRAWLAQVGASLSGYPAGDINAIRASGAFPILNAEDSLKYLADLGPNGDVSLHPLIGGMPPVIGWEQLRQFEKDILPRV